MKSIYVARHTETKWNKKHITQGHLDSPLTDLGIEQAKKIAKKAKKLDLNHIYSSDLGRTKSTTEIILHELDNDVPVTFSAEIRERNFGKFNGKPSAEVKSELNNLEAQDEIESIDNFQSRVWKFINSIDDPDHSLIITHAGVIRILLASYHNCDFSHEKARPERDVVYRFGFENSVVEKITRIG